VKPPSPQSAIVCLPGKASCAPKALGAAWPRAPRKRAKDSALVSTFDVPGGPDAGGAGVHEEHGVGSGKIAESRGEKFRRIGLMARSLFDIVVQELLRNRVFLRGAFPESLHLFFRLVSAAETPESDFTSPTNAKSRAVRRPMCLALRSICTFFTSPLCKKFGEREIRPKQQQKVRLVNGFVSSAVAEQPASCRPA